MRNTTSRMPQGLILLGCYLLIKLLIVVRPPQLAALVSEAWWRTLAARGLTMLFMAALIPILLKREGTRVEDLGYAPRWSVRALAAGLGGGALILLVHETLLSLAGRWAQGIANAGAHDAYAALLCCMGPAEKFGVFYQAVVMTPLIEEVMYRGCLRASFARRWGRGPRFEAGFVLASGLLFAALHQLSHPLYTAVYMVTGSAFALLYLRARSLNAAVLGHAVVNCYYIMRTLGS